MTSQSEVKKKQKTTTTTIHLVRGIGWPGILGEMIGQGQY